MLEYFTAAKGRVSAAIGKALAGASARHDEVSPGVGADAARRLAEFSSRGKMIRGCLVRLGYELALGRVPDGDDQAALDRAGAAMELFQSGLLVHDDIMDRDRVRRGFSTLHVDYEEILRIGGYDDPPHYGEALGICAGDLAYFLAFELLAELPIAAERALAASRIAAAELCLVGVAQMQDVANGALRPGATNPFRAAPAEPSEADVIRLYRYKTGRYTFSLPLALGAAIAGASDGARTALETAGEELGVLFQLKDDELGLFADEAELGKPVGADIREDKKTPFRLRLMARAEGADRERLSGIFGNRKAGAAELKYVQDALGRYGVRAELRAEMEGYARRAVDGLASVLGATTPAAAVAWRELVAYSLERRS